jgi:hypothetical protein
MTAMGNHTVSEAANDYGDGSGPLFDWYSNTDSGLTEGGDDGGGEASGSAAGTAVGCAQVGVVLKRGEPLVHPGFSDHEGV